MQTEDIIDNIHSEILVAIFHKKNTAFYKLPSEYLLKSHEAELKYIMSQIDTVIFKVKLVDDGLLINWETVNLELRCPQDLQ